MKQKRREYYDKPETKERLRSWSRNYYYRPGVREKKLIVQRNKKIRKKFKVISYYSRGAMCCEDCGDRLFETLTINHLNESGQKHRRELGDKGKNMYQWLISNGYPEGYNVLCIRCNWLKGKVPPIRYLELLKQIRNDKHS